MKYIVVTQVDSFTKVPAGQAPMLNGPAMPAVKGLSVKFADESNWPIVNDKQAPLFYATCDNDADLTVPGVIQVFANKAEFENAQAREMAARLPSKASPRQIRLALLELGMLQQVTDFVAALPEPLKSKVDIEWEYATEISKHSGTVKELMAQIGFTSEQVDEIFVKAAEVDNPVDVEGE